MYFSQAYPTTKQTHFGNTFQLTLSASTIQFLQASAVTDTYARGNSFNIGYSADNLEVHHRTSCQACALDSSEQHNLGLSHRRVEKIRLARIELATSCSGDRRSIH